MIKRLGLQKQKLAILMAIIFVLWGNICSSQPAVGLDALEQISAWPIYRQGVQSLQVSSYDQTGGDNDYSGYLYQEGNDFVIFDQAGPGCIYRIWMRGTASSDNLTIKFYFDGETIPRINTTVAELFSGLEQPFSAPLVGNTTVSSGGYYCYFPIPFENHLKVALRGRLEPHQIQYHLYPAGTAIASYTGGEDPSTIVNQWMNTGEDPKDPSGNITESGAVDLLPRQSTAFFDYSGAGSIASVRLTITPLTLSVLESLILHYTFDDAALPQVDASLGSFFDCSLGATTIDGLFLGVDGNEFYCFFPMPFWESAHLEIYNSSFVSTVNLNYEVTYKTESYDDTAGYFTARKQGLTNSTPGQPIQLGSLSGHGNFVGLSLALIFPTNQQVLHSDLRCYVDGRAHPILQGTDLDGDFNAGNYLTTGAFDLPVHGFPLVTPGLENQICAYRHFLGDLIPFSANLSIYTENGPSDDAVLEYSAVIYAYSKPELTLLLSDEIDVGDDISELAHSYIVQGGQTSQSHYYTYPGIADDQYFTDDGRTIFGQVNFTVSVDPDNEGVRLARRRDASILPQAAVVYVEGDSVGIWWDGDFNNYQRWGDSVFEIPANYTSGLSELDLNLTYLAGEGWTEYYYWITSHVAPYLDLNPPDAVTNLRADEQESGADLLLNWDAGIDNAGISHYRIFRSAEWGVEPVEDYFLGNSNLPQYLDGSLLPGSYYYYLVTAVDFAGNEGMPSAEVEGRTSSSFIFEGEACDTFLTSSGDTFFAETMTPYGDWWSNQQQLLFGSDEIGDFFEVEITISLADTFDIAGYFTNSLNYGDLQLEIDGEEIGGIVSLYSPTTVRSPKIEFATIYLDAGDHSLLFRVVGKNNSSLDYRIGWDNLLLTSHYLLPVEPASPANVISGFQIESVYPNPFNAQVKLQYSLPGKGLVEVSVYDLMGRKMDQLLHESQTAGNHQVSWNAEQVSSGLYFIAIQYDQQTKIQKALLLK